MRRKKEKIDTSPEPEPLLDNPFARLLGGANAETSKNAPQKEIQTAITKSVPAAPVPQFKIARTKKGGFPIHVEKRGGGKCVTVVERLSGDLPQLLKDLRKLCGSGGTLREDAIELQGDHCEKLEAYFKAQQP